MQGLITEIIADIRAQAARLDDDRRRMFMSWLQAHHPWVEQILENELKEYLTEWLAELSPAGVLWEYRLILSEIGWWRALDEQALATIMETDR